MMTPFIQICSFFACMLICTLAHHVIKLRQEVKEIRNELNIIKYNEADEQKLVSDSSPKITYDPLDQSLIIPKPNVIFTEFYIRHSSRN